MEQQQIVVKTEVQPNGDILLFYVDDNEDLEQSILENPNQDSIQILSDKYIVEEDIEQGGSEELDTAQASEQVLHEVWQEEEIRRLIVFYLDNKETFLSGTTKNIHLWAVACKTMLHNRQPISCEVQLRSLKQKYAELRDNIQKGINSSWPFYELCHRAFHDDAFVQTCLNKSAQKEVTANVLMQSIVNKDGVLYVKTVNLMPTDEKVEAMLNLYIKHRNSFVQSSNNSNGLWERITMELGEDDVDYWHKRFLNSKRHYIKMLDKRNEEGPESITWPYMKYFDKIFANDVEFHKKYVNKDTVEKEENLWNDTEKTFLVKYYFDCLHEFQDPTIPDKFLWQEIGRLLDKTPDDCKKNYEELKNVHFNKLCEGGYNLTDRVPLDILFDNIIAKEVRTDANSTNTSDTWKTGQVDELVQYLYENINMLKDSVCYYVCWATLAKKLNRSVQSCIAKWNELTSLYKNILEDKRENSDLQIDWRYIDLFDRIFDYGMDTNLLEGYEKIKESTTVKSGKIGVKKIIIKDDDKFDSHRADDEEIYDERGFMKHSKKKDVESKGFKILEYYLKHKDKFTSPQQRKVALWEVLARQIGTPATECAHRFRNFKQLYTSYVQREINKPEMPILWPYYNICKKIFGHRSVKSKLKNGKFDSDDVEDWTAKEIKQLISFVAKKFDTVGMIANKNDWAHIARQLGRSEKACCDKFLELRRSYRKLVTMKTNRPNMKVSWKYFNMLDDIYKGKEDIIEDMDVDQGDYITAIKTEPQEDDDFQCIIVIPEGGDINDAQILIENNDNVVTQKSIITKWNRRSKTKLLIQYLKYLKAHNGEIIKSKDMWTEIASRLDEKTPISCRKMYLKLKAIHKQLINENSQFKTKYCNLLARILKLKQKFMKFEKNRLDDVYEDVVMADFKVQKALSYYLENLEDFVSPKFEQRVLWSELAKFIGEPVNKIYSKINYLKETFNHQNESPFKDILTNILMKEHALKESMKKEQSDIQEDDNEQNWSDIEIERLLTWYLAHLDKFKNPKFVRSYLWMEASDILKKSALVCSKKMLEIRSQYRTMVRENPVELESWKFYNLCQRIYGTGKKTV